jgi:RNA polymerase sigma-70 factor (ECF subfamily)
MVKASRDHALATLVAERGGALWRYAYLISGNVDDAADLVQDALVHTFSRARVGLAPAKAEAYVRRAILNGAIDRSRRSSRWRGIRHLAATDAEVASPAEDADERIDLLAMVQALPPRQRACIVLRYYDDLTVDAIAETLGIGAGSVKRYLSDGVAGLAARLDADRRAERSGVDT